MCLASCVSCVVRLDKDTRCETRDARHETHDNYAREERSEKAHVCLESLVERWGAGVETQKYVRGDIGGWGRVPFNETYAPSLSTIYDGA